jgi:hypothetical protein
MSAEDVRAAVWLNVIVAADARAPVPVIVAASVKLIDAVAVIGAAPVIAAA